MATRTGFDLVRGMVPAASRLLPGFRKILDASSSFEPKGIFSSELLLLCCTLRELGNALPAL